MFKHDMQIDHSENGLLTQYLIIIAATILHITQMRVRRRVQAANEISENAHR